MEENTVDVKETDIASPDERLRSSNASSSSSTTRSSEFEDFVQLDPFESGRISSKYREEYERETREPDSGSPLQSPPVQTMERPAGESGYRIPSRVFARGQSGNRMDWSSLSNESLFSIHTGNMSFTVDQFNLLMKSGELSRSGEHDLPSTPEEVPTSPMHEDSHISEPSNPSPTHDPTGSSPDHVEDHDPREESASPAAGEVKPKPSNGRRARPNQASSGSNASGQSFEFPLLEGGFERGGSSVKSGLESLSEKPESPKKPSSDLNEAHDPTVSEASNGVTCPWFSSCMSYFSCCAKTDKEGIASKD